MGKGKFRPPTAPTFIDRSYWNSNVRNTSGRPPHMLNFVTIGLRGWAGRPPSLSQLKEMTPQRDDAIKSCDVVLYDSLFWRFVTLFSLFVLVPYSLPLSCHERKLRAFLLLLAHLESSKSVQNWRSYTCLKSTCLARQYIIVAKIDVT